MGFLVKPVVFAAKAVGGLAKALPALVSDTSRVLQHPSGIKQALSAWWRGHLLAPTDIRLARQFDGTIEGSLNALKGASKEIQIDLGRKFKAKSGTLIRQQAQQLQKSAEKFEDQIYDATTKAGGLRQTIQSYEQQLSGFLDTNGRIDPSKITTYLAKLDEKEKAIELREIYNAHRVWAKEKIDLENAERVLEIAKNKRQYVEQLKNGIDVFNEKLERDGIESALKHLDGLENSILKPSASPMLEELGYIEGFTDKLKASIPKEMKSIMSEGLISQNLDSKKYFLKEWARMRSKSKETYDLWASNPKNADMIRELEDSDEYLGLFGKKLSDLAKMIKEDVKSASSFAGRSPQDIAHMLKLPAAALGTIGASVAAFKTFSWFSDSNITLVGTQARTLVEQLEQLETGGRAGPLVDQALSALSIIESGSAEIKREFGNDPVTCLNDHIPAIARALMALGQVHNQWNTIVADSADQNAAQQMGFSLGKFIINTATEFKKLVDSTEQQVK